MAEQVLAYTPRVFIDTTNLSREEWLTYRRQGIGGSDAAAIMGISPFRTARDIYYDKLNLVTTTEYEGNWVALKMGHLLEDLVAEIFTRKTGLPIFKLERMFQHPLYPFMLADVDFFITLPNGRTAILEIKTTNYNAKSHWWSNGQEIVLSSFKNILFSPIGKYVLCLSQEELVVPDIPACCDWHFCFNFRVRSVRTQSSSGQIIARSIFYILSRFRKDMDRFSRS